MDGPATQLSAPPHVVSATPCALLHGPKQAIGCPQLILLSSSQPKSHRDFALQRSWPPTPLLQVPALPRWAQGQSRGSDRPFEWRWSRPDSRGGGLPGAPLLLRLRRRFRVHGGDYFSSYVRTGHEPRPPLRTAIFTVGEHLTVGGRQYSVRLLTPQHAHIYPSFCSVHL